MCHEKFEEEEEEGEGQENKRGFIVFYLHREEEEEKWEGQKDNEVFLFMNGKLLPKKGDMKKKPGFLFLLLKFCLTLIKV